VSLTGAHRNDVTQLLPPLDKDPPGPWQARAALPPAHQLYADRGYDRDAWSEHQPSTKQENDFIATHGIGEYAKWHLGVDDDEVADRKAHYKFPYGDFDKVHRCGVLVRGGTRRPVQVLRHRAGRRPLARHAGRIAGSANSLTPPFAMRDHLSAIIHEQVVDRRLPVDSAGEFVGEDRYDGQDLHEPRHHQQSRRPSPPARRRVDAGPSGVCSRCHG
jgi:hypothetical protein